MSTVPANKKSEKLVTIPQASTATSTATSTAFVISHLPPPADKIRMSLSNVFDEKTSGERTPPARIKREPRGKTGSPGTRNAKGEKQARRETKPQRRGTKQPRREAKPREETQPCTTHENYPVTSPRKPWDRVALKATPFRNVWRECKENLNDPLPGDAPQPERFSGGVVLFAIEALLGQRPVNHLKNWMAPEVYQMFVRRCGLGMRLEGKILQRRCPKILRMSVFAPLLRVREIIAVIEDGIRIRAAAFRIEFNRNRWEVVALELG
ncbi:Rv3235 family protein [Actinotignum urinale]|nr:Rv3235 family protein [Actinotignum urinale]MDY5129409.1 Rv3235 family protein [Actinotignum urinale]MDY5161070.1 Rv3235 family protein [Actinotignum urinale]WIK59419.1 Rv3235 family protein [Actinotignum urinale]